MAFFAAKAAAHTTTFHADSVHRHAQRVGDLVLDFGRVLGRTVNDHVPVILGEGKGRLTLKVEMFLPTHVELTSQAAGGSFNRGLRIALGPRARPTFKEATSRHRVLDREDRLLLCDLDFSETGRFAGVQVAVGDDHENRLADVVDLIDSEQGFVMDRRADII